MPRSRSGVGRDAPPPPPPWLSRRRRRGSPPPDSTRAAAPALWRRRRRRRSAARWFGSDLSGQGRGQTSLSTIRGGVVRLRRRSAAAAGDREGTKAAAGRGGGDGAEARAGPGVAAGSPPGLRETRLRLAAGPDPAQAQRRACCGCRTGGRGSCRRATRRASLASRAAARMHVSRACCGTCGLEPG